MFRAFKKIAAAGILLAAVSAAPALAQPPSAQQALTPVQLAYLKAETKKANDSFVKQVAKTTGTTEAQVRRALPDEKRITDRLLRLISALEKDLKRPLTDEEKAAITIAEDERKKALAELPQAAAKK